MSRTGIILLALFLVAAGIVVYVVFFRDGTSFGGGRPPSKPGVIITDHSYRSTPPIRGEAKPDSCCLPLCDTIVFSIAKPGLTVTYDSIVFFSFLSSGGSTMAVDFNYAIMGSATRYEAANSAGNGMFSVLPSDFIAGEDSLRIKCLISGNISAGSYTFESQAGFNTSMDSLTKTSYSFGDIANGCTKTANSNPFITPR